MKKKKYDSMEILQMKDAVYHLYQFDQLMRSGSSVEEIRKAVTFAADTDKDFKEFLGVHYHNFKEFYDNEYLDAAYILDLIRHFPDERAKHIWDLYAYDTDSDPNLYDASRHVEKTLVLSTAHLKAKSADLMDTGTYSQIIGMPYGWIVNAGAGRPSGRDDIDACQELAESLGCEWLIWDRDEEEADALPVYDWGNSEKAAFIDFTSVDSDGFFGDTQTFFRRTEDTITEADLKEIAESAGLKGNQDVTVYLCTFNDGMPEYSRSGSAAFALRKKIMSDADDVSEETWCIRI